MILIGSTNELIIGSIHQIPDSLDLAGSLVYELLRGNACFCCLQLDLLTMLIGTGLEPYIIA